MSLIPRDYQMRDIQSLRHKFRPVKSGGAGHRAVLYQLSTGGGKTAVAAFVIDGSSKKGLVTWFTVHRIELVRQSSKTFTAMGIPHGIIATGFTPDPLATVQICMVQTLVKRLGKVKAPDFIIPDECFPAGTRIGNTTIEKIKVGDIVDSFNHSNNRIEKRKVLRVFKNPVPDQMCKIKLSSGVEIICTLGHPFYVPGYADYIPASLLVEGDYACQVQPVWGDVRTTGKMGGKESERGQRPSLLQQSMLYGVPAQNFLRNDGADQPQARIGQDDRQQSYGQGGNPRQNVGYVEGHWAQAHNPGRQRQGVYGGSNITVAKHRGSFPVRHSGIYPENRDGGPRVSEPLQNRHRHPEQNGGYRSGRGQSPISFKAVSRPEENRFIAFTRVESVEIQERRSDEQPAGLRGQDFVYNIEVEENHNYFAEGVLVHNCHHLRAKTFSAIIDYYPKAKVLGLSATPCRLDGQGLGVECGGHFDDMVASIPLSELIAEGYLVQPIIYAPPVGADFTGVGKRYGEFVQSADAAILDKPKILGCAIDHYRKICDGQKAIVFCASVKHAEDTAAHFNQAGYRAASLDGTMHDNERKGRVNAIAEGRLNVLTSVDLVSEGFDLPSLMVAIMLRRSASLAMILQMIGRVLRPEYAPGFDLSTKKGRLAAIAASGKPHAYILDHVGNIRLHNLEGLGLPEFDIEWGLDGSIKRKKGASESSVAYRNCPECYRPHPPAPVCPYCGFEYGVKGRQLEQVDGELGLVDPNKDPAIIARLQQIEKDRAKYARLTEERQCTTLDQWKALGEKRGYSPAWALIRWNQRKNRAAGGTARLPGVV